MEQPCLSIQIHFLFDASVYAEAQDFVEDYRPAVNRKLDYVFAGVRGWVYKNSGQRVVKYTRRVNNVPVMDGV